MSALGKARSAGNALGHGITARLSVRPDQLPQELAKLAQYLMSGVDHSVEAQTAVSNILVAMIRLERAKSEASSLLTRLAPGMDDDAQIDFLLDLLIKTSGYETRFRGRRNRQMRQLMLLRRDNL